MNETNESYICCCVCLLRTGKRTPAVTVANTYATCAADLELVTQPNFDIFRMHAEKKVV